METGVPARGGESGPFVLMRQQAGRVYGVSAAPLSASASVLKHTGGEHCPSPEPASNPSDVAQSKRSHLSAFPFVIGHV